MYVVLSMKGYYEDKNRKHSVSINNLCYGIRNIISLRAYE